MGGREGEIWGEGERQREREGEGGREGGFDLAVAAALFAPTRPR